MKKLLCFSMILGAVSAASAATPVLYTSDVTGLGNGLYATTISLGDGTSLGAWAVNLTFTGSNGATINQVKALGTMAVNSESLATGFDALGDSGYSKLLDTWYYDSAFPVVLSAGVQETANGFQTNIGTAAGVNWGDVNVVRLVATGGELDYSGTVGRGGQTYDVSGTFYVPLPEPTTLGLMATGSLLMLRRRRASR